MTLTATPQPTSRRLVELVNNNKEQILRNWTDEHLADPVTRLDVLSEQEVRANCREFFHLFEEAINREDYQNESGSAWESVRKFLANLASTQAELGLTSSETAVFVFSLKFPLMKTLWSDSDETSDLQDEIWSMIKVIDKLGLYVTEAAQMARESTIRRQQQEMLELSTPVIKLWDGIIAVPLIGTLDSERTQLVMEALLSSIVNDDAEIAIIDITGVPTVDTLVAQHLLKTVAAARLMGAECIISGVRPQIAQTIVHLGIDIGSVATKSTLADALGLAFSKMTLRVTGNQDAAEPKE